eukprot:scaffold2690_cov168-Skeletonema_marinoi.AAC.2
MMKQIVGGVIILSLGSPSHQFKVPHVIRSHGRGALTTKSSGLCADITNNDAGEELTPSDTETKILQLAQSHFVGQALLTLLRVGVMDVLHMTEALTVDEIITKINDTKKASTSTINREALFRSLRLVCTSGVVGETTKEVNENMESAYFATDIGMRLQTTADKSMAPFILHWLEDPLWNAWSELPSYVESTDDRNSPPFDRANGMSASEYYLQNAESCSRRNSVARYASTKEISSIIEAMKQSTSLNESALSDKVIVDVGGGYGDFVTALKESIPTIGQCYCLDLADVIADAKETVPVGNKDDDNTPTLVAGNMFDPTTIPPCDVIFTKHVLCDFPDEDVVQALKSFRKALADSKEGKVVIMDAALPNGDDLNGKWNAAVSFDVLLMLSGRRGERSQLEWSNLAKKSGFVLEDVLATSAVTVDLAVLSLESP